MPRSFKLAVAAFALSIGAALVTTPAPVQAGETEHCHAKSCEVGGETSVCCLRTSGSIDCSPCGAIED